MEKRGSIKKGQVTLFVIIAIIIAAGIAAIFVYRSTSINKYPADINSLNQHIRDCLDLTAKDTLKLVGFGGGYIFPPENSLVTEEITVDYWYDSGKNIAPMLQDIEQEINSDVVFNLEYCLDFSKFPTLIVNVTNLNVISRISQEETEIQLNMPMTVNKGDINYKLEAPYKVKYPIRLGMMQNLSETLIDVIKEDPEYRPISYLVSTFNVEAMNVTIIPYNRTIGNETIDADIYIIEELLP